MTFPLGVHRPEPLFSFESVDSGETPSFKGAVPDGSNKVIDFSSDWLQIGSILVVV